MRKNKYAFLIAAFITAIVVLGGLFCYKVTYSNKSDKDKMQSNNIDGNGEEEISIDKVKTYEEIVEEQVQEILDKMTIEEKISSLFIVECNSLDNSEGSVTSYNENVKNTLNKYPVGGVILFSDNIVDRQQVISLNSELQKNSSIPMFIGVDEEGGKVSRIGSNTNMGTTKFGNMRAVGDSKDSSKAYEVGKTIGREIRELGFNLDFAPDADVLTNPDNTEIGSRSFGTDENVVAEMALNVTKGLQENNVCSVMKHFPGHGASTANSHNDYSYTPQNLEGMRKVEFIPFKRGIEYGVDFILVSHIAAPNVTGDKIPASLSGTIVNGILRNELKYDGIVITDAMNMKAVSNYYSEDQMYVNAIQAGCDMMLMPEHIDKAYDSILKAYNDGVLSEERINESVKRVLKAKLKRNIIENNDSASN
ncbi:MAG: glycoside hydrolase family 3 protein [Clostridium sp.]|nr:glycoside hydrolase family 3 protein [Clostridium sp.]